MRFRFQFAPLAALALVCFAGSADAQTKLRYKFAKGDKNTYEVTQDMKIAQTILGMNIDMEMKQTMEMTQAVKDVLANGNAVIDTKLTRVKMAMKGPVEVDIDSANLKDDDDNPVTKIMAGSVKALAKLEFTTTMTPTGDVVDFKIADAIVKELRDLPGSAQMGDMFSEQGIKQMMSQNGLVLPKDPIAVGGTWSQKVTTKLPFGKMAGEMKYTYQGTEKVDGKTLQKIGYVPALSIEPGENAALTIKVNSQKGAGVILFDNETGVIRDLNLDQTMEMAVSVGGQNVDQTVVQKTGMKLRK